MATRASVPASLDRSLVSALADLQLSRAEARAIREGLRECGEDPAARLAVLERALGLIRTRGGPEIQVATETIERLVRLILGSPDDPARRARISEAHFSPDGKCRDRIVSLLGSAQRSADVCVFTITNDEITGALLRARRRPIAVRVITEHDNRSARGSDIARLERAGIDVREDLSEGWMHHKFAVLDGWILLTGSFNWTRSAQSRNEENLIVTSDPQIVGPFQERFERLWGSLAPSRRPYAPPSPPPQTGGTGRRDQPKRDAE